MMRVKRGLRRLTALAVAISIGLTGCASIDQKLGSSSGTAACVVGGAFGAIAGAMVAKAAHKDAGAGAVVGAGIGCGVTLLYQNRVKRLQGIAQSEHMDMDVKEIVANTAPANTAVKEEPVGIEAQVRDGAMFAPASAELTADGQRQLHKVADAMAEAQKTQTTQPAQQPSPQTLDAGMKVLVVGHTDSTGSAAFNQELSEKRARAVSNILAEAGIKATDIYYQGAGSSRPVADNTTETGRAKNRRVEMSQIDSKQLLVERVRNERNNPKYLEHGTRARFATAPTASAKASKPKAATVVTQAPTATPAVSAPPAAVETTSRAPSPLAITGKGGIDFGGHPVTDTSSVLVQAIEPKRSIFSLVSVANASALASSCVADMPRTAGQVMNLATGKSLDDVETIDYLPGMDGRPWAQLVNGHLASVGPVSILNSLLK